MVGFNVLPDRFRIRQLHERFKEKTVFVRIDIRNDLGCEQIIVETIRQSQIEKAVIPDHYGIADIPGMFAQQGSVDDRFLSCDLHVASFPLLFYYMESKIVEILFTASCFRESIRWAYI